MITLFSRRSTQIKFFTASHSTDGDIGASAEFFVWSARGFIQVLSQSSNALNKSTQGLWRRNKLNLNGVQEEQPSVPVVMPQALVGIPPEISAEQTPAPTKRKPRSTREDGPSKRTKLSAAKDYSPPPTRLSDLGGIDACIEKILELVAMPLCHPEIYLHTGVQPPRGVLLHGPPGCGKTMLANAIAGVGCSFIDETLQAQTLISVGAGRPFHKHLRALHSLGDVWGIGEDPPGYL